MEKIILASKSPRRTEILTKFNIEHEIIVKEVDEIKEGDPVSVVSTNAFLKGESISKENPERIVLSADTIVLIDGIILGKPKDLTDAFNMLKMLQGRTHQVITAVSIFKGEYKDSFYDVTDVIFNEMNDEDIYYYLEHEYVLDKAGAYAVQSDYSTFINKFIGSYYNVVGLPIEKVIEHLKKVDC